MKATAPALSGTAGDPGDVRERRPRRKRRNGILIVVVVLVGAGIGVAIADPFGPDGGAKNADSGTATSTATVTKGRLTARVPVNGTLGYGGSYKVVNRASGTYTRLPRVGEVISPGKVLYRVNGKPVVMLTGSATPAYRELTKGIRGSDVRQLNAGLVALGYADKDDLDPKSSYFGWATKDGVKELQDDLGVDDTGTLGLGEVVFLPGGKIRVTEINVTDAGLASPGADVLAVSSTVRQVSVNLEASGQAHVKVGDEVTITLPNLKTTAGRVSSVGTVAKKLSATAAPTIEVKITPKDVKATGALDQAPVAVSIVTDSVNDVLAVPVNALLALASGGYAVEVVDPAGAHRLVQVTLGLFDNSAGTVAVSGTGLAVGQHVVVPTS